MPACWDVPVTTPSISGHGPESAIGAILCNYDDTMSAIMAAGRGVASNGTLRRLPWALLAPVVLMALLLSPAFFKGSVRRPRAPRSRLV